MATIIGSFIYAIGAYSLKKRAFSAILCFIRKLSKGTLFEKDEKDLSGHSLSRLIEIGGIVMKRVFALILLVVFATGVTACESRDNNGSNPNVSSTQEASFVEENSEDRQQTTIEGEGFTSPEEAILAYAKALKAQDLKAMMSCFAIESYVANYNMPDEFERIGAVMPNIIWSEPIAPTESEFMSDLNIEKRRSAVVNVIMKQLLALSYYNGGKEYDGASTVMSGSVFSYNELTEQERYSDSQYTMKALQNIPELEVGQILQPYELQEQYLSSANLQNLRSGSSIYRAEGIKSTAIQLNINGSPYLLSMDAIRYNGKWYLNSKNSGNLAALLGIPANCYGLTPFSSEDVRIEIHDWDWIEFKSEFAYSGVEDDLAEWLELLELESMQEVADFFSIPELAELP